MTRHATHDSLCCEPATADRPRRKNGAYFEFMSEPAPERLLPIILTVDDDSPVSMALARDLRRRYGDRFRVLRAESGHDAIKALRELELRGDTVALLIVDYRMPHMDGVEFLEQAIELFPAARRIMLTAYADEQIAADAIKRVKLDHYLLKPWNPPETGLYPVVDTLLRG